MMNLQTNQQQNQQIGNPYDVHKHLIEVIKFSKRGFIAIGKLLSHLREDDAYLDAVGEGIDTWDAYLSQPEIGLSRGEANRLIQIYEQFCVRFGFDEDYVSSVPVKNLHYLLPIVKDMDVEDDVDELLADAQNLSQKDFREKMYEIKQEEPSYTYEYLVMKQRKETGQLSRVHGIESEEIKNVFDLE